MYSSTDEAGYFSLREECRESKARLVYKPQTVLFFFYQSAHALRNGRFASLAQGIVPNEGWGALPTTSCLERIMKRLRSHRDRAS